MFPAYAGMIRRYGFSAVKVTSVPRLRGDDPMFMAVGRPSV